MKREKNSEKKGRNSRQPPQKNDRPAKDELTDADLEQTSGGVSLNTALTIRHVNKASINNLG